jgi:putative flippase GtrA
MAQAKHRPLYHKELRRFVRFAAIGVVGTLVDFGLLVVFKEGLGFPTLIANTLSYSAGIANNFTLNRLWTYSDSTKRRVLVQLAQFTLVSLTGLLLNNGVVLLLEAPLGSLLGVGSYGYLLAKSVATGFVMLWNFAANRLWTFGDVE